MALSKNGWQFFKETDLQSSIIVPLSISLPIDFLTGSPAAAFARIPLDDDYVQARCMWLVRHGQPDEADELLEDWCVTGRLQ